MTCPVNKTRSLYLRALDSYELSALLRGPLKSSTKGLTMFATHVAPKQRQGAK